MMTAKTIKSTMPSQEVLVDRFRRKYWELNADAIRDSASGRSQKLRPLGLSSVIVPLDGSRYAEHALPLALEVAAASKAPIVLESAHSLIGHGFDDFRPLSFEEASSPRRRGRVHTYLEDLADRISTDFLPVMSRLRDAPVPGPSLSEAAGESSLVVMAQRPYRFADPFSLGHSVERLLKFGSSPVIFVRGYRWPYTLRKAQKMRHILVVLDGTPEAEHILSAATAIAEAVRAQITLLHVVPGMPYYEIPWTEKETEAKAYLENVAQAIRQRRVTVESAIWSSNESIGEVVLSYAQNSGSDLIALAASLRRTLVGSVRRQPVRYLVRKSGIPLLIVCSDKAASNRDQLARPHGSA
jgi:nucleotide-binding universal stress UspA family protein